MDILNFVERAGGFATTQSLRGFGRHSLELALDSGALKRVRRGHVSNRSARDPEFIAVRVGGKLTGLSAIQAMHGWVWNPPTHIQVAVHPHATRLRRIDNASTRTHWGECDLGQHPSIVPLVSALERAVLDEPIEVAVAAIDWGFRAGLLDFIGFESILLRLPARFAVLRSWVDPHSQSILESIARVRILRRGWRVRSQVRVGDVESIDLLIEGHVALELDGRRYHESTFENDRRKDLRITIEGRHSLRVSEPILRNCWVDVERAIEAALAARRHGDSSNSGPHLREPRATRVRTGLGTLRTGERAARERAARGNT